MCNWALYTESDSFIDQPRYMAFVNASIMFSLHLRRSSGSTLPNAK